MEARWVFVFLGAMALLALAMPAARADAIDGIRQEVPNAVQEAMNLAT